jgi:TRAP transporter 4TM/12TM fusion protein
MHRVILAIAAAAAAFHLYAAGVSPFTALVQRPTHLLFMAALAFLGVGVRRRRGEGPAAPDFAAADGEPLSETAAARRGALRRTVDVILVALAVFACGYLILQHGALVRRAGNATPLDLVAGAAALLVVLEMTRRATGMGLVTVALAALVYGWAGPWLPGALAHRGYPPSRLLEHLYLTAEGIWGVPLGVSADFVYLFVLFGALLEVAGGGELLISLASRVARGARGAAAMTAAIASALMGSLSGSAVANVVTTGTFTIPLMRRAGFRPHFAAAIEAAASTGGQIMPPVMGAGAFILATWTGIPYARVAVAAVLPAVLYYLALLFAIHFRAVKMQLPRGEESAGGAVWSRLHLLVPLVAIVAFLALGRSPMRAAFWGVVTAAGIAMLRRETRLDRRRAAAALASAASSTVQVAAACACAGIVVGVASLTGIGLRMSELIVTLSGGSLFAGLVLTALGSIVLGMGLPTTAAYVVLAALGAPALVELGAPLLAAHLFIFYFGCISNVTPPVALAAFAAAGIAGAPPMRTAATALSLASAGILVPFTFVYGPALLLAAPPLDIVIATVTATAGVAALAAATIGWLRGPVVAWERAVLAACAVALIFPGWLTDGAGLVGLAFVALRSRARADAAPMAVRPEQDRTGAGELRSHV